MDDGSVIDAETTETPDIAAQLKIFEESIPKGIDPAILEDFLARTAESNKDTVESVKLEGAKNPTGFWKIFAAYKKQMKAKKAKEDKGKKEEPKPESPSTSEELAPKPCPDHPESTYTKAFCDKCAKHNGCPVWG
jgi:hypothetical protein